MTEMVPGAVLTSKTRLRCVTQPFVYYGTTVKLNEPQNTEEPFGVLKLSFASTLQDIDPGPPKNCPALIDVGVL